MLMRVINTNKVIDPEICDPKSGYPITEELLEEEIYRLPKGEYEYEGSIFDCYIVTEDEADFFEGFAKDTNNFFEMQRRMEEEYGEAAIARHLDNELGERRSLSDEVDFGIAALDEFERARIRERLRG